jgi:hypothetical protein
VVGNSIINLQPASFSQGREPTNLLSHRRISAAS